MLRPLRPLLTSIACLALAAMPAAASWMTPPSGYRAKDFALVKRDGVYHVFYIRNQTGVPFDSTEVDFGHAVSNDLYVWTHLPPVLAVRDDSWDRHHVWAPSIVEQDGIYYLFYTGVTHDPPGTRLWQRTGVATSTDLMNWNRLDQPVFTCASVPWAVCDSTTDATAFRDPCVVRDVNQPGRWLMVYGAYPQSNPGAMVAGLATSTGDLLSWQDHGPLWISHQPVSGNDLVESPLLFESQGLYYLFFTTSHLQHLRFATSPDPTGSPALWNYRGALSDMIGMDTSLWFASEHLRDGLVDYFGFINGDRVDVREIKWTAPDTFTLIQPDVFHVVRMSWAPDSAAQGDTTHLVIEFTNGYGRQLPYEVALVHPDGSETLVDPGEFGVQAPPTMWNSPAVWKWPLHSFPDSTAGGDYPQVVVRTTDRTCASRPLRLLPGGRVREGRRAGGGYPYPRVLDPGAPKNPTLRQPILYPFAGRHPVVVEMPGAAPARLDIFDLSGRRVRTLADRRLDPGAHVIEWDGRDRDGRALPHGLYFARLVVEGRRPVTARMVLR